MRTMIDNAKIAQIEKDIKATDAKVKAINSVPASTAADAGKVLTVGDDGTVSWQTKGAGGGLKAFFDAGGICAESKATNFDGIIKFGDTADVTDMTNFFANSRDLVSVPLIDTSKATTMYQMFYYCQKITSVPLFDTSKVTSTASMFHNCVNLTSVPTFNTSEVTSMFYMFYKCINLTSIPAFDVSKSISMTHMIDDCSKLEAIHMKNIGTDLDISQTYSTKFTREALLEIIGNLKTVTTTKTLTLGSTNLAKLTDEDKAIATNKGWTLA